MSRLANRDMPCQPARPRQPRTARGVGLVEAMITLGIIATLLTSLAAAYTVSARAIEINDQFARATQAARVSVNLILTDVRKSISTTTDEARVQIEDPDGVIRRYAYDSANRRLTLELPHDQPGETFVLARNVIAAQFDTDDETISVLITVQIGQNQVTLSGSAMPRRTINQS